MHPSTAHGRVRRGSIAFVTLSAEHGHSCKLRVSGHKEVSVRTLRLSASLVLIIALAGCAGNIFPSSASRHSQLRQQDITTLPRADVERELPDAHPSAYYLYASRLFKEGDRQDAVVWFYIGEIRYRFYLRANPGLPADGDPALFGSLHQVVGTLINGWAGGDPDAWLKDMQSALDWDASHDNGFTSKTRYAQAWRETRAGLEKLEMYVMSNKAHILEERKKNGL